MENSELAGWKPALRELHAALARNCTGAGILHYDFE
jgi:hypothetical protein